MSRRIAEPKSREIQLRKMQKLRKLSKKSFQAFHLRIFEAGSHERKRNITNTTPSDMQSRYHSRLTVRSSGARAAARLQEKRRQFCHFCSPMCSRACPLLHTKMCITIFQIIVHCLHNQRHNWPLGRRTVCISNPTLCTYLRILALPTYMCTKCCYRTCRACI